MQIKLFRPVYFTDNELLFGAPSKFFRGRTLGGRSRMLRWSTSEFRARHLYEFVYLFCGGHNVGFPGKILVHLYKTTTN